MSLNTHSSLTNLLLPRITDRVVVVSSDPHRDGRIDFDDLNGQRRPYKTWDPGYAATDLQGRTASPISDFFAAVADRFVAQSDTLGALPTLYAATADIPGGTCIGPDGCRHMRGHPTVDTPALQALDAKTARRLWELSEQLTGVSWPLSSHASS
jgi:hypothetical protein